MPKVHASPLAPSHSTDSTPESSSETSHVISTTAEGAYSSCVPRKAITGGAGSTWSWTDAEVSPPAEVAVQLNSSTPSATLTSGQSATTSLSRSVTVQLTSTAETYHPFAPSVPETELSTTGGDGSTTSTTTSSVADRLPSLTSRVNVWVPSPRDS